MPWSPWQVPTRTFWQVPHPIWGNQDVQFNVPYGDFDTNGDGVNDTTVTREDAFAAATGAFTGDTYQSLVDNGVPSALDSVVLTGGLDEGARQTLDANPPTGDTGAQPVLTPQVNLVETNDSSTFTHRFQANARRSILYYNVGDPPLATDQPLPEMDGLVAGVDFAPDPVTGQIVQYQHPADLIGWYFNVGEVPAWYADRPATAQAAWWARPAVLRIWKLEPADVAAFEATTSTGTLVPARWHLPTGAPWLELSYTHDQDNTYVPITPAPDEALAELGTERNFALLFSVDPPAPLSLADFGDPVVGQNGVGLSVSSGWWANAPGWANPPMRGLIPTFRVPPFRYWMPPGAAAAPLPYLRMHQRNDGLGPNRHPRLSASRSTSNSVQHARAPRVGIDNRYR